MSSAGKLRALAWCFAGLSMVENYLGDPGKYASLICCVVIFCTALVIKRLDE
jgi:hypothetical protein